MSVPFPIGFSLQQNQLAALISQIYFVMKLYMFRTVRLSIIRTLFTVHSAMLYVIQVCRQDGTAVPSWSCSTAVHKSVWHIPLLGIQWINSWWWTDELSKTCRVSWQNKFVKLLHLVGFITKIFVTMHGHMNVKKWFFRLVLERPKHEIDHSPDLVPSLESVELHLYSPCIFS